MKAKEAIGILSSVVKGKHSLNRAFYCFDLATYDMYVFNRLQLLYRWMEGEGIGPAVVTPWRTIKGREKRLVIDNRYVIGRTSWVFVWLNRKDRKRLPDMAPDIPPQSLL